MAKVGAKDSETSDHSPVRRNRWTAIAGIVIVAGFVSAIGYFGLKYVRDTSYQDERAFRVLGQIVGQFGNLQEAIAGALQFAPRAQECITTPSNPEDRSYVRRLVLRGHIDLKPAEQGRSPTVGGAPFQIKTSLPERTFYMSVRLASADACRLSLSGSLRDQISIFITQALFDSVAVATANGKVLAMIPQDQDPSEHEQLHSVSGTDLFGGDVSALLSDAAQQEASEDEPLLKDDKRAPTDRKVPGSATVYAGDFGGQPFRVFVLPFEPTRQTIVDDDTEAARRLYLIGLKRQDLLLSLNDALGSGGALVVTLGVLLGVLAWPFVSLRFSSPQEAIAPTQLLAILLALLLIPAVLATAGFSYWTRYRLMHWADQHAEIYASRVERSLIQEMDWGIHSLESLAVAFEGDKEIRDRDFMVQTASGGAYACVGPQSCSKVLERVTFPTLPKDWSPLRSAAPLNAQGKSSGLTLSFFQAAPPTQSLNLEDREYYHAIMAGEDWRPGELWPHDAGAAIPAGGHRYVAQRLFNRTDAARALQLSVPIEAPDGTRAGLVTGDTRVYGLTAGVRPPLLRFAIIDHRNGTLLFHTDDQLSLAENLLVETENNSSLLEGLSKRASGWGRFRILLDDHFSGRYMGAPQRFYHRAIPGTPWGLIVFYETDVINTIVLQTAVATLATYFASVLLVALLLGLLVIVLPERADISLLKSVWPKWNARDYYRRITFGMLVLLSALAILAVSRLNRLPWLYTIVLLVLSGLLLIGFLRLWHTVAARRPESTAPSVTSYNRRYVAFVFSVLCLVSAVPAIGIAIGYHDTSLHASIRDELLQATRDEEQRRRAILRDDRRFNDSASPNLQRAVMLSNTLPVPGYRHAIIGQPRISSWVLTDSNPTPWLSECGPRTLDWLRRGIWRLSTARQVQRPVTSSVRRDDEDSSDAQDGAQQQRHSADRCPAIAVRAWRRSEDGTQMSAVLPLQADRGDMAAIGSCDPRTFARSLCRDPELHMLYSAGSGFVLAATTTVCALLILLLSAHVSRRLFGVRIPFAGRFTPSTGDAAAASDLLDLELQLVQLKSVGELQMTSKDEADWRAVRCEPIYRRMWESLSTQEQLFLHHLAEGRYANPENQFVIEQLLRRGYITLAPWPRIVEPGFVDFVRRVDPSQGLHDLRYETSHTPWGQWRTPLLVIFIVTAGLLMWLAGSAMHILAGTLAGIATLLGSITRVTGFIHRDKPPPTE